MATYPTGATDVKDETSAKAAAQALSGAKELAVDVEADSMHAFHARLCYVQVASDDGVFLFDTLAPTVRADVLADLFADPARTKVFHAAGGDLQFLAEAGVRVRGLFDTHRAATLLGWPKVGLADLARERVGVELPKEYQQADWSIRPLPDPMRVYLANDVRYLVEIGRQVREACVEADILEEVLLDCDRMTDEAAARPDVLEAYKPKLPRNGMSREQIAIATHLSRALHEKRLAWAEKLNIPMGRMLSNAAIVEIATKLPSAASQLQRLPGVRGGFVREHGEEVIALVNEWKERAAKGELPADEDRGPRDPLRKKREDALKTWRNEKASLRRVTPSVVLTNPLMNDLAARPPSSEEELLAVPYFGEKRVRLYGRELLGVLSSVR